MADIKKGFLLKFVLVVSSLALMIDLAIYPAADAIYTVFADANIVAVNTVITGPSLMIVFGSIICGFLTQVVGKKTILAISYFIFCVTAISGAFINTLPLLLVMRLIAGVSVGFISISSVGLIAELFSDEKLRSRMMGTYTGVMCLLGAAMSFAAGWLALIDWHYVFYIYIVAVPILVGVICCLPKTAPEGKLEYDTTAEKEKMNWGRPLSLAVAAFVLNCMYAVVLTMMAVFLAELEIGDSSTAGTMGTVTTLGSMAACFIFGWVYMKTKRATPIIFSILMGIGFVLLGCSVNVLIIGIAVTIMGAMYGLSYSYYLMYASMIVPPSKTSLSISIANAAVYAGLFCGPYVCPLYERVFKVDIMAECMPYLAATCAVYAVLAIILVTRMKKLAGSKDTAA